MNPALMLLMRRRVASGGTLTGAYAGYAGSTSDLTSYSIGSVPFGAAASDRTVVVGIWARAATAPGPVASVTIGGVSATIAVQVSANGNTSAIAYAAVPTGTSGTVAVVFTSEALRCGVFAYRVTGGTVAHGATATATTDAGVCSVSAPAGSFTVALAGTNAAGDVTPILTWSGVTFDHLIEVEAGNSRASTASRTSAAAETINAAGDWALPVAAPTTVAAAFYAA